MKHIVVITVIGAALAGCSNTGFGSFARGGDKPEVVVPVVDTPVAAETPDVRPTARPEGGAPTDIAPTDEVPTDQVAAEPPKPAAGGPLGVTVASLGNPGETGLWLKTPLVKVQQAGRVSYGGKTANVMLIPIEGAATAGSRMSLQAFQTLDAPLVELITVNVSI